MAMTAKQAWSAATAVFRPASRPDLRRRWRRIAIGAASVLGVWLVGLATVKGIQWWDDGHSPSSQWVRRFGRDSEGLIVIVHGWTRSPTDVLDLARMITELPAYRRHAIYLYGYPAGRFSNKRADDIAQSLADCIATIVARNQPTEVILVGHSLGGLLLRRAYLAGLNERTGLVVCQDDGTQIGKQSAWSKRVSRLVLLAAPNRGIPLCQYG